MLVAPTGRAAVRMTEASGLRARTVHSALGWIPGEGPTHDQQDPLGCDLLIVDETSMANLELLVTLLRAVGDEHPRGPGRRRRSARAGRRRQAVRRAGRPPSSCPTTRLTHIFRQAAGSMIVQGAHAIRRGEPPEFAAARRDAPRPVPDRARRRRARRWPRSSRWSASACPPTTASIRSATSRCSPRCTAASSGSTRSTWPCARRSTPTASRCAAAGCGSATS